LAGGAGATIAGKLAPATIFSGCVFRVIVPLTAPLFVSRPPTPGKHLNGGLGGHSKVISVLRFEPIPSTLTVPPQMNEVPVPSQPGKRALPTFSLPWSRARTILSPCLALDVRGQVHLLRRPGEGRADRNQGQDRDCDATDASTLLHCRLPIRSAFSAGRAC
jgi:hypothetical protein